jgi:hypothetical protein
MDTDSEHLKLLSIFHYVVGGLAALFSLFPVFHLVIGIAMVTGRLDHNDEPGARLFGWFFVVLAAGMIAIGLACAVGIVLAGRFLARRTYYLFCLVMAAVECLFIPFGTVLGVFTILVLQRPTVKAMFADRSGAG